MAQWLVAQLRVTMLKFYFCAGVNLSKNPGDAGDSAILLQETPWHI